MTDPTPADLPTTLAAIAARAAAATPGPWKHGNANEKPYAPFWMITNEAFHNPGPDDEEWVAVELHTGVEADAEFIAAARTDIPLLLAAVQAVLDLHEPVTDYGGAVRCDHCLLDIGLYYAYPCPTVAAITAALTQET